MPAKIIETNKNPLNDVEVDVLYGQHMKVGTADVRFAAIEEIIPPTLRPTSKYKYKIVIRRDAFEAIVGGNVGLGRIGGTFDVTDPQFYKNVADTYSEGKKDAKRLYRKARNLNRLSLIHI